MVLVDFAEIWGRPSVRRKALASNQIICPGHQRLCLKHIQTGEEQGCYSRAADCGGIFHDLQKSEKMECRAHVELGVGGVKLISTKGHISIVAGDCKTVFKLLTAHKHTVPYSLFELKPRK